MQKQLLLCLFQLQEGGGVGLVVLCPHLPFLTPKKIISPMAMMSMMLTVDTLFNIVFLYLVINDFPPTAPARFTYAYQHRSCWLGINGPKRCPDYFR